ncbi:peptidoglycan/LPS O-acetylase OafA/YrhL [Bradyrhizobium sp. USDA 4369]
MTDKATKDKQERRRAFGFGIGLTVFGIAALVFEWFNRDAVAIVGAVLLGFVIGMLVGFFVQEAKEWTRQAMTASVAVIASAGVLALLRYAAPDPHDVWFYPAGLVIGFGFGTIWDAVNPA